MKKFFKTIGVITVNFIHHPLQVIWGLTILIVLQTVGLIIKGPHKFFRGE